METAALEKPKDGFVGCFDGGLFAIGDGFSMNRVAAVVIEEKNVVVAADGRYYNSTCLNGADQAGDGVTAGVDVMGSMVGAIVEEW